MSEALKKLKEMPGAIAKGDSSITPYLRDTMIKGDPDVVLRPRDKKDIREILELCRKDKIPATVCGAQTSMSGAAAALSGAIISTEKIDRFIGIEDKGDRITATAETGALLIDFKKNLEENGYFYPTHPTSVNEIFLGSSVATNATGDDTYKYGPTRRWVRRIKVILIDGSEVELVRPETDHPKEIKGRGGYYLDGSEIDHFIGSEGTLGIITEVTVDILKNVPEFYSIMIPFSSNSDALKFIKNVAETNRLAPRSLEYVDDTGVGIMRKNEDFPNFPEEAKALVYCNQEHEEGKCEESISDWLEELQRFGLSEDLINSTIVAATREEQEEMHSWRHFIPEWVNESYREYEPNGGGKVGGDWWVPLPHMLEMMKWFYDVSHESGIPFIAYAHLGNGHPHTNYFTHNSEERAKAKGLVMAACRKAVSYGGGIAGEHGIGKIYRHLLPIQHSQEVIDKMKTLKSHYDPDWLLGRDNIFKYSKNS